MRTQAQILDVTVRAKCGYVLIGQYLTEKRLAGNMTGPVVNDSYSSMLSCYQLIKGIEFKYLTLRQQNLLADRLVRAGAVVKNETSEVYVNLEYSDYVNFSS